MMTISVGDAESRRVGPATQWAWTRASALPRVPIRIGASAVGVGRSSIARRYSAKSSRAARSTVAGLVVPERGERCVEEAGDEAAAHLVDELAVVIGSRCGIRRRRRSTSAARRDSACSVRAWIAGTERRAADPAAPNSASASSRSRSIRRRTRVPDGVLGPRAMSSTET